uniref:Uncharacterized protein n=1 Tax=Chenopodium quinoa TaxID=63459 RepID=A0A803LP98_CHEQI
MKRGAAEVCTDNYAASSKKLKFSHGGGEKPTLFDYSDPFTIPELLDSISWGKYGSVTKDVEALVARKVQVFNSLFTTNPEFEFSSPYAKYDVKGEVVTDIVDLDSLERKCITPRSEPLLIIESDDEEDVDRKNFLHFQEIALPRPPPTNIELHAETLRVENYVDVKPVKTTKVEEKKIDKDVPADQSGDEQSVEEDEGCDHSYVLKDDIGYVCRVCGVIQRAIETIFDFQYIKV